MPDINVISISPSQLSGSGEAGLYDVARFQKKYLAQGDSWFSIGTIPPWSTTNLLQQMVLSRPTLVVNCARPGIELAHMTDTSTARVFLNLLNANIAWKWDGVLMSGGGNDLIDAANTSPNASVDKRLLLKPEEWSDGASPSRYLSDTGWATFAGHMSEVVDLLLAQRDKKAINRDAPIFFHTYDYVTPRNSPAGLGNGPWLVKALDAFGIPPVDWNAVSDELINRHAAMWLTLAGDLASKNVHVVDSRGATTRAAPGAQGESNDWENEIHPTANGYSLLAKRWRPQLDVLT
jgi:lysophospholipase L1-like esterase